MGLEVNLGTPGTAVSPRGDSSYWYWRQSKGTMVRLWKRERLLPAVRSLPCGNHNGSNGNTGERKQAAMHRARGCHSQGFQLHVPSQCLVFTRSMFCRSWSCMQISNPRQHINDLLSEHCRMDSYVRCSTLYRGLQTENDGSLWQFRKAHERSTCLSPLTTTGGLCQYEVAHVYLSKL